LAADALLNRMDDLAHEITLLKLGLAELHARLESTLALSRVSLCQFEDVIRRREAFFAGDQEEGDDLVGDDEP
jgi:hypothetical protein